MRDKTLSFTIIQTVSFITMKVLSQKSTEEFSKLLSAFETAELRDKKRKAI